MKKVRIILSIVSIILFILLIIRIFAQEDAWICTNGEWIKHGNPSAEKPIKICEK